MNATADKRQRFDRPNVMLAMNPQAFGVMFDAPGAAETEFDGEVAVVRITGPLTHHSDWWCDSYDAIRARVQKACESPAQTVVLKIDSPGGDVSGCFETARELRRIAASAGKRLLAYADGQACSGAYALACAAEQIIVPEAGFVGSIGVINTRIDITGNDSEHGIKFAITTSGARKADGHPHSPVTPEELANAQATVDSLAGVFFALVQELRGMPAQSVAALEAGVFHGQAAVNAGLADSVQSFEQLLATLATGELVTQETKVMSKMDEARAALEKAAEGDDEEAKKAKRALAAMDEEETPAAEGDDPPADDDEPAAEGDDPPADDDEPAAEGDDPPADDDEAKAKKAKASSVLTLAAEMQALGKRLVAVESATEADERKRLLSSRPDMTPALKKSLGKLKISAVREIVAGLPKPKVPSLAAAATAAAGATRGATQGPGGALAVTRLSDRAEELDRKMGITSRSEGTRFDGTKMVLGVTGKPGGTPAGKGA